jgi:hypothetical protein
MPVTTFTLPYFGTPPYFSGISSTSDLVPSVFPVAIDGRPYMLDQKSGKFQRGYEQRVRDSTDDSTTPGEGAINPGGLWRRGQDSWHLGAGQDYADTADSKDYRFYKSKGIDPWTKGQLSLLNATKRSLESASTNLFTCVVESGGTEYLYVADNQTLKYSTNPYAATPTWTSVTTGAPAAAINDITTDGEQVYVAYTNEGILKTNIGGASLTDHYATTGGTYNYTKLGFAKGYVIGVHNDTATTHVHIIPYAASTSHGTATTTLRDPSFVCTGIVGGQNHIYISGHANNVGVVYRLGIKADGTVDVAVVALELPNSEYPTALHGYLGFIIIGTNKGVRYCSADSQGNLIAGSLIPTTGAVNDFTSEDRFVWFTYTDYDNASGGLGRLDLSVFIAPNTPAYATDLMYSNTGVVKSVSTISGKRVFTISGVGVIVEDVANLVATGEIETGTWRWGIPDRKFIAKIDTRSTPLIGAISSFLKIDNSEYGSVGRWADASDTENSFNGSDDKAIEAGFKFVLERSSINANEGPTFTRWMARAYAAPFRSQVFSVPILLHKSVTVRGKEYYYDVYGEQLFFDGLIESPRIVTLQTGNSVHSVILEDVVWEPTDSSGNTWEFDGTLVVTLRSVEN